MQLHTNFRSCPMPPVVLLNEHGGLLKPSQLPCLFLFEPSAPCLGKTPSHVLLYYRARVRLLEVQLSLVEFVPSPAPSQAPLDLPSVEVPLLLPSRRPRLDPTEHSPQVPLHASHCELPVSGFQPCLTLNSRPVATNAALNRQRGKLTSSLVQDFVVINARFDSSCDSLDLDGGVVFFLEPFFLPDLLHHQPAKPPSPSVLKDKSHSIF
mmetsp:Transcript_14439/g.29692  ORF Transcript_14439/g.29692 Transcript_14439/m.29692 type:complete len:209 (-) Transcript_14439:1580-2206(-)